MWLPHNPYRAPLALQEARLLSPLAVNIDFCGYLQFFGIGFVWTIWVKYTTENLSGQQLVFVS